MQNFLNLWLRGLSRSPIFSTIKIAGFGLGLAVTLLLLVYGVNELSFDRFHKNSSRIYRGLIEEESTNGTTLSAVQTAAVAVSLQQEIPEIESMVRFANPIDALLEYNQKTINAPNLYYADSSLFRVFSFDLKAGNPDLALSNPYSIILSQSLAKNLFGDQNPIGQVIILDKEKQLKVTGLVEDAPANSQLNYSAFISFNSLYDQGLFLDWNGGWNYFAYFLVYPNADPNKIIEKSKTIFDRNINNMLKDIGVSYSLKLEPLTKVHLFSDAQYDLPTKGSLDQILILSLAGLMVLIMACVNFITMSAVQATSRLKEIGVRKVIGALPRGLFIRFMLEAVLITLISLVLASAILILFDPAIENYLGTGIIALFIANPWMLAILLLLIVLVGFISGAYPAFILSGFKIADALRGRLNSRTKLPAGITILILFQFVVTITLFILTETVYNQRNFIASKDLGYKKENLVVFPLANQEIRDNIEMLENEIAGLPEVISMGASSEIPGNGFTSNGYFPEGHKEPMMINVLDVDANYLNTMEMVIVDGRNFSEKLASDQDAYVINEALARKLGWVNPIGKTILRNGEHTVVGVVKDFNYNTLHHPIEPLILTMKHRRGYNYLTVRIAGNNIPITMEKLSGVWNKINPPEAYDPRFLDQTFAAYYQKEKKLGEVFLIFALIAIGLCASGLLGTVSYSMKGKVKEIGIRKVLGANTAGLIKLLSSRFFVWIILANVVAIPLSIYLSEIWLERFEYSPGLSFWLFLGGFFFSIIIGLSTSGVLAFKAASSNPIYSLKQE